MNKPTKHEVEKVLSYLFERCKITKERIIINSDELLYTSGKILKVSKTTENFIKVLEQNGFKYGSDEVEIKQCNEPQTPQFKYFYVAYAFDKGTGSIYFKTNESFFNPKTFKNFMKTKHNTNKALPIYVKEYTEQEYNIIKESFTD